ncbi:MAG TPA: hypothetical protein VFS70_01830, partial [Actinomycetota bacterium]|nr:hypothetical protein [Actinomycetota bacterium]
GALVGYVIFTLGLGIGDTDIFDWGGLFGAIIGTLIVLGLAGYFLRRRQARPAPSMPPPADEGPQPLSWSRRVRSCRPGRRPGAR